jgi:uncharacterized protein (DUF169 family)
MNESSKNAARHESIKEFLGLKFPPVALKLVTGGEAAPEAAYRPSAHGKHLALCQAFALARRDGKTIYMGEEDHWCWNPLIAFGHVKCEEKGDPGFETICSVIGVEDPGAAEKFVSSFMKLPYKKYDGVLIAPLDRADFPPDVLLIYCEPGQLRTILLATRRSGQLVRSEFDALDSCLYATIPPLLTGDYRITFPDPGEYERALTDDHTVIFSVPTVKLGEFFGFVEKLLDAGTSWRSFSLEIKEDFPRPPFYDEVFKAWGLDTGDDLKYE